MFLPKRLILQASSPNYDDQLIRDRRDLKACVTQLWCTRLFILMKSTYQLDKQRFGHRTCRTRYFYGYGTERPRLGTYWGYGTERARLSTFRGFGTERARLNTFRGFGSERARLSTLPSELEARTKDLIYKVFSFRY